jgi:hypothetical protein
MYHVLGPLKKSAIFRKHYLNIGQVPAQTKMPKDVTKCQVSQNVKCHKMSTVTKCQLSQNVKCHKMSSVTKCQVSQNVKCHKMSSVTKCQRSQNVTVRSLKSPDVSPMRDVDIFITKRHKMSQNVKRCHKMSQDVTRC